VSQTRVPCSCNKCGHSFAVVYEIDRPGPLTWKTVACPRDGCKNVVKFPIPENASFAVESGARPGAPPAAAPTPPRTQTPVPWAVAAAQAAASERSESHACASCGHGFNLSYKYLDADAETVAWIQCPNCGTQIQVWLLEGAHDMRM